jgi:hypothetical protein
VRSSKAWFMIACALLVAGVAVIMSPARRSASQALGRAIGLGAHGVVGVTERQHAQDIATESVGTPSSANVVRPLAAPQRAGAVAVATRSVVVKALLHGARYRVAFVAPWVSARVGRRLGAAVVLKLVRPSTMRGMWPTMRLDPYDAEQTPYATTMQKLAVRGVTEVLIDVDSRRLRVVNVAPMSGAIEKETRG